MDQKNMSKILQKQQIRADVAELLQHPATKNNKYLENIPQKTGLVP